MTVPYDFSTIYPYWLHGATGTPTAFTFNASTRAYATIFRANKNTTITEISVRARTLVGTSPTFNARVETVGSQTPTGTLWATNTNKTFTVSASNTIVQAGLTASASISAGDTVALVIRHSSGTINSGNHVVFDIDGIGFGALPSIWTTTGTWTRSATGNTPAIIPTILEGQHFSPHPFYHTPANTESIFNNTSSVRQRAMDFGTPGSSLVKIHCIGAVWQGRLNTAGAELDIVLYNAPDEVYTASGGLIAVRTATIKQTEIFNAKTASLHYVFWEPFTVQYNPVLLAIKPTSSNNIHSDIYNSGTAKNLERWIKPNIAGTFYMRGWSADSTGDFVSDNVNVPIISPLLVEGP